jgi:hypothetical protein
VVLFLSDIGPAASWGLAPPGEIAAEAGDREMEVIHHGRKSPDVILRLPEGTKTWEARVGFETAWRNVTGESSAFVARSARSLILSYLKGEEIAGSLTAPRSGTSAGLVFLDLMAKRQISRGEILVIKKGKEEEQPSFARVARIVHECYRSVLETPVQMAGRGLKTLKGIREVIEEHAPKMLADVGLLHEVRRELENGGLA